jgi:hypothetical protein
MSEDYAAALATEVIKWFWGRRGPNFAPENFLLLQPNCLVEQIIAQNAGAMGMFYRSAISATCHMLNFSKISNRLRYERYSEHLPIALDEH